MTHEHDHDRLHRSADAAQVDLDPTPARGTRSSQLDAPAHPITSGLIQRKARDANGVAADADQAVAAAGGGGGSSLPDTLMRKFESSLGTDLSSVRVHTGGDSATAAHAVGAKAYTMGQDIHFGAGQYDPSSPGGQHLIAHEVAHTVQQRGGSPTRQNKLEVSAPHDAAEHEADRAADAMVTGKPAAVSGGGGLSRQIYRDPTNTNDPFNLFGGGGTKAVPQGKTPDPDDVYEQPPVNFDLGGSMPPREPQPWFPPALNYAHPLPALRADGSFSTAPITEAQKAKSARCVQAFETVHAGTVDIWNATALNINEFQNAAARADELHITGAGGGDFDKPADVTQNLDQLGDAQKVGPQGNKSNVADLFSGGKLNVAANKVVKDEKNLDGPLNAALVTAETTVQTALNGVDLALGGKKNNALKIKQALAAVDVAAAAKAAADEGFKSKLLAYDKAQTGMAIDNSVKIVSGMVDTIVGAASDKPDAMLKGGLSAIGTAAKWVSDSDFDALILKADKNVLALQGQIASLASDIAVDGVTIAINEYMMDNTRVENARAQVKIAMVARKNAYDTFAAAAGAQAKKGGASDAEAAKIEGAIKAIPIVEEVVMRIKKVTTALKSPPPYSDDAGIGFRAAGSPAAFSQHYAWLKTYVTQFSSLEPKWTGRLAALQKLAGGMYSKAT